MACVLTYPAPWPRRKVFIFNRKERTLTYPGFLGLHQITLPFDDISFVLFAISGRGYIARFLAIRHPTSLRRSIIDSYTILTSLSLYVWYMDRNRPLPPGSGFDPYREKDFLRRYSEGFPAPLYPSMITIPEFKFTGTLPTARSYFASNEAYHRANKPEVSSEMQKRIDAYNAYRDGKKKYNEIESRLDGDK